MQHTPLSGSYILNRQKVLSNCFVREVLIPAINRAEIKIVYFLTFAQYLPSVLMKYDKLIWFSLCTFSRRGGWRGLTRAAEWQSLSWLWLGRWMDGFLTQYNSKFAATSMPSSKQFRRCVYEFTEYGIARVSALTLESSTPEAVMAWASTWPSLGGVAALPGRSWAGNTCMRKLVGVCLPFKALVGQRSPLPGQTIAPPLWWQRGNKGNTGEGRRAAVSGVLT